MDLDVWRTPLKAPSQLIHSTVINTHITFCMTFSSTEGFDSNFELYSYFEKSMRFPFKLTYNAISAQFCSQKSRGVFGWDVFKTCLVLPRHYFIPFTLWTKEVKSGVMQLSAILVIILFSRGRCCMPRWSIAQSTLNYEFWKLAQRDVLIGIKWWFKLRPAGLAVAAAVRCSPMNGLDRIK